LEHGCFLSHFTLRRRQVTQERALKFDDCAVVGDALLVGFRTLESMEGIVLGRRIEKSSLDILSEIQVDLIHIFRIIGKDMVQRIVCKIGSII
jgi:hypothetical protein